MLRKSLLMVALLGLAVAASVQPAQAAGYRAFVAVGTYYQAGLTIHEIDLNNGKIIGTWILKTQYQHCGDLTSSSKGGGMLYTTCMDDENKSNLFLYKIKLSELTSANKAVGTEYQVCSDGCAPWIQDIAIRDDGKRKIYFHDDGSVGRINKKGTKIKEKMFDANAEAGIGDDGGALFFDTSNQLWAFYSSSACLVKVVKGASSVESCGSGGYYQGSDFERIVGADMHPGTGEIIVLVNTGYSTPTRSNYFALYDPSTGNITKLGKAPVGSEALAIVGY